MIPLWDESRRPSRFPAVTVTIIALNALAFAAEIALGEPFVDRWAAVPADIAAGRHLETLLTSMFLHGSWSHIVGNMIFLWAFGPEIEDAMNPARYGLFYLSGGVVAMLAQIAGDPSNALPGLGASGAVAAVMGAFLVTYPRDRIRTIIVLGFFWRIAFVPAILLIGLWFLFQLVSLGAVAQSEAGGVAYLAHVGGVLFGALTARLFEDPRRRPALREL